MTEKTGKLKLVSSTSSGARPRGLSGVYLVTDEGENLLERVARAISGGVTTVQYRAKLKSRDYLLEEGARLKELCKRHGVTFVVNDSVALAKELDADGVHLGQGDGDVFVARKVLDPGKLIGVSTHDLQEAMKAEDDGADYIGFGSIFPTASKTVSHIPGTAGLASLCGRVSIPVVAIGGITPSNAVEVIDAGADAVAVISSVLGALRPEIPAAELRLLFNRKKVLPCGAVLTIAGSDSGGGAGIQADLKTVTLLGSYGASVITALTAQNTRGVSSVHGIPPSFVRDQLEAVFSDIPIDVIKTGMLHTPAIIAAISEFLASFPKYIPSVVDPVMVAKGGASLLERDAVNVFRYEMLPRAFVLTPNIPEAEKLLGRKIDSVAGMEEAAADLQAAGAAYVLLKGGHLPGPESVDVLFDGTSFRHYSGARVFTTSTHGTGCTFASAVSAFLSQGEYVKDAVRRAKEFISAAIGLSHPMGKGHGPVNHYLAAHKYSDSKGTVK